MEGYRYITTASGLLVHVNIPKTATRSIAGGLGLKFAAHRSRRYLEKTLTESSTVFIACVRHPLDRLVSWHAYHAVTEPTVYFGKGVHGFREWVRHGCAHTFYTHKCPMMHPLEQWRWIRGDHGSLRILRFESLADDWAQLCLDYPEIPHKHLQRINVSGRRADWREYYDEDTLAYATCTVFSDLADPQINPGGIYSATL